MIENTTGIVLNYIKYKETSIIVRMYTRRFGLKSFVVNSIRSKKAKKSIGTYQPCTLLDIQIYYHEGKDLLRLSDAKRYHATPSISQNIRKSTIALFITEILGKTLYHEHYENMELYRFIEQSIIQLEDLRENYEDFHLKFLIQFSPFLGFALSDTDMMTTVELSANEKIYLDHLIKISHDANYNEQTMATGEIRHHCLKAILAYYHEHMDTLGEIKSLKVLHQIFH